MKAVIQRVTEAEVLIDGKSVGKIAKGLLVLLGVTHTDTTKDSHWLAEKIAHLRIFPDSLGKMNLSVQECHGDILVVSQFTLYANAMSGRRPDFIQAAVPEKAIPLYEECVKRLEQYLKRPVPTGQFGAKMQLHLVNDGPVTLVLESPLQ